MGSMFLSASSTFDIDSSLTTATKIFNWVLGVIADNPLMAAAFAMAILIPAGIMAFRSIKSAV